MGDGLIEIGMCRRPRVDQRLARHPEAGADARRQRRFGGQQPGAVHGFDILDPVAAGLRHQLGQRRLLPGIPGEDEGTAAVQRQVQTLMNVQIFGMTGTDAVEFQRALGRVEAGMQDGAVALGGAVQHVMRLFQQHHPRPVDGETAGKGAADDPGADDCHIVTCHLSHSDPISCRITIHNLTERAIVKHKTVVSGANSCRIIQIFVDMGARAGLASGRGDNDETA